MLKCAKCGANYPAFLSCNCEKRKVDIFSKPIFPVAPKVEPKFRDLPTQKWMDRKRFNDMAYGMMFIAPR